MTSLTIKQRLTLFLLKVVSYPMMLLMTGPPPTPRNLKRWVRFWMVIVGGGALLLTTTRHFSSRSHNGCYLRPMA